MLLLTGSALKSSGGFFSIWLPLGFISLDLIWPVWGWWIVWSLFGPSLETRTGTFVLFFLVVHTEPVVVWFQPNVLLWAKCGWRFQCEAASNNSLWFLEQRLIINSFESTNLFLFICKLSVLWGECGIIYTYIYMCILYMYICSHIQVTGPLDLCIIWIFLFECQS